MRFLSLEEVYALQARAISEKGGRPGVRDAGAIEAAVAQPQMTYGREDIYRTLADKAAALGFSLIKNHAFVDGNKRVGHAAMETFLVLNGCELVGDVDEHEQIILALAASEIDRDKFAEWVRAHVVQYGSLNG